MTVDSSNLTGSLGAAAGLMHLPEQVTTASGALHVALDQARVVVSASEKENRGRSQSPGRKNRTHPTVATKIILICLSLHNIVQRDMNCLNIRPEIILVHYIYHVILLRYDKQKNGARTLPS